MVQVKIYQLNCSIEQNRRKSIVKVQRKVVVKGGNVLDHLLAISLLLKFCIFNSAGKESLAMQRIIRNTRNHSQCSAKHNFLFYNCWLKKINIKLTLFKMIDKTVFLFFMFLQNQNAYFTWFSKRLFHSISKTLISLDFQNVNQSINDVDQIVLQNFSWKNSVKDEWMNVMLTFGKDSKLEAALLLGCC